MLHGQNKALSKVRNDKVLEHQGASIRIGEEISEEDRQECALSPSLLHAYFVEVMQKILESETECK